MAEYPALPLFTDAYLGDTMHLSLEEHGAYLKLIMSAWRSRDCALPDDETDLARVTGLGSVRRWRKAGLPVLVEFFRRVGLRWEPGEIAWRHVNWQMHPCRVAGGRWTEIRAAILASREAVCSYCGTTEGPFEIDHIRPRSKGGTNEYDNLTVACRSCTRRKHAKDIEQWLAESA